MYGSGLRWSPSMEQELHLPDMTTNVFDRILGRVRLAELDHILIVLTFLVQALRNLQTSKVCTLNNILNTGRARRN